MPRHQASIAETIRTVIASGLAINRIEVNGRAFTVQTARNGKTQNTGQNKRFLTIQQACIYVPCSRAGLYKLLAAGKISAKKNGSRTLIDRKSLDTYLAGLKSARISRKRRGK